MFQFGKCLTPLYSYCKYYDEKPLHVFSEYEIVNTIWNELSMDDENLLLQKHLLLLKMNVYNSRSSDLLLLNYHLPLLLKIDVYNSRSTNLLLNNHLLLLLKMYVYNSRSTGTIILNVFLVKLSKIEHIENYGC